MKKILLAVIFVTVFSTVGANAQTIFIPQPPVIHIPLLDPSRMIIQNEVIRNSTNAGARRGAPASSAKARTPAVAAADGYTAFTPRQENYLPRLLAQSGKGNAAEQRQAEQFYNSQIDDYEKTARYHHLLPPNDVAYALVYFIVVNYQVYYDLYDVPQEKDPWAKRARNNSERVALMNEKKARFSSEDQDRAIYYQLKNMLSAKPEFRKMTDKQKQEITEILAIKSGVAKTIYLKAIEEEDEKTIGQAHQMAKQNLEESIGFPVDKVRALIDSFPR